MYVLAHGLGGTTDLPIPAWLFAWGAGLVLVVSFAALGSLWRRPKLASLDERRLLRVPAWVDVAAGTFGVAVFALVLWAGFAGAQGPTDNLAPTAIWVVLWPGMAFLSLLLGDVWAAVSPWRAIGRAAGWVAHRVAGDRLPAPSAWPARLGTWPAVLAVAGLGWLELVWPARDEPAALATVAAVYAAVQLVGMTLCGVDAWARHADGLGALLSAIARLSPLHRREDGALYLRVPTSGAATDAGPPVAAIAVAAIGVTTFDGAGQSDVWADVLPALNDLGTSLGLGVGDANTLSATVGLLACLGLVAGLYGLGIRGMRAASGGLDARALGRAFGASLLPIVMGYVAAHYLTFVLTQGQAAVPLASDPLGRGWDVFGTASVAVDYTLFSGAAAWTLQLTALVAGHVAGLVLAHDRGLELHGTGTARAQQAMLVVMVAFTSLGLWLLTAG